MSALKKFQLSLLFTFNCKIMRKMLYYCNLVFIIIVCFYCWNRTALISHFPGYSQKCPSLPLPSCVVTYAPSVHHGCRCGWLLFRQERGEAWAHFQKVLPLSGSTSSLVVSCLKEEMLSQYIPMPNPHQDLRVSPQSSQILFPVHLRGESQQSGWVRDWKQNLSTPCFFPGYKISIVRSCFNLWGEGIIFLFRHNWFLKSLVLWGPVYHEVSPVLRFQFISNVACLLAFTNG